MAKGHFDNKLIIEDFTQATQAHHGNVSTVVIQHKIFYYLAKLHDQRDGVVSLTSEKNKGNRIAYGGGRGRDSEIHRYVRTHG